MSTSVTEQFSKGLEDVVAGTTAICSINPTSESLLYRGYSAFVLAEQSTFEEVLYLLVEGRLPKKRELKKFTSLLVKERKIPNSLLKVLRKLPASSDPMGVLRTSVSYLGTIEGDRHYSADETKQIAYSLIAKLPLILMSWFYLSKGEQVPQVSKKLSYAGRLLQLICKKEPDEFEEKLMNAGLILYAEHEFNASTFNARVTVSTLSDVFSAITAGIGALKGPLHGGAIVEVMKFISKFSDPDDAERYVIDMIDRKEKIMGFGHRVYKKADGRAVVLKKYIRELALKKEDTKLLNIAERVEKIVKERKGLIVNADFYSGILFYLLGIPVPLYTTMFAISRMSGWSAHIMEQLSDNRILRPRAIYTGPAEMEFVPLERR